MTDKEVIKALECCKSLDAGTCKSCVFGFKNRHPNSNCINELCENALDLINRQQAEIENLRMVIEAVEDHINPLPFETDYAKAIRQAKSEAIKEFWSRLQGIAYQSSDWSHGEHPMVVELDDAEEIYEEMVGEDE